MKYSCLILLFFTLIACDSNRLYEKNIPIKNKIWALSQAPSFEFNNKDTVSMVNMHVNVRHSSSYPFSNLWLFINTTTPNGSLVQDTLECVLAEKNGKWLGNGLGDIWDIQCYFKSLQMKEKGAYRFNIEQAMRHGDFAKIELLPGIMEVGLRIEKQE